MIPKLAKLPLESQPGTEFRYGLQQEVQGAILRRITGEQLDTLLERLMSATSRPLLPRSDPADGSPVRPCAGRTGERWFLRAPSRRGRPERGAGRGQLAVTTLLGPVAVELTAAPVPLITDSMPP
jgi:hypothetical protein